MTSTIDENEVKKFSIIADEWWDERGKFKPLHKFNPIRISFIRQKILDHLSKSEAIISEQKSIFSNLDILDVGCGGGLISEPLARIGANVTAIDASEKNIQIAKIHAKKSELKIEYLVSSVEEMAKSEKKFDVVLALEIIEHVADVELFIKSCSDLVKTGGILFVATINRTPKSLVLAKFAAEYLLRWLPAGTHNWEKFVKPSELNESAEKHGLTLKSITGFSYNILKDEWKMVEEVNVNYIAIFQK